MKKVFKQLGACLIAVLLFSTISASAISAPGDSGIMPHYEVIRTLKADLTIDGSGKSTCSASCRTASPDYSIELDCKLQNTDGTIVKSWSTSGQMTASMTKSWYVRSGAAYQVVVTARVYDSNGTEVDHGTACSPTVSY